MVGALRERKIPVFGIRFSILENGEEAGRATLYILTNDLHNKPFGLMEDVYVNSTFCNEGIGARLVEALIERTRTEGCYKLIATSRNDGTRDSVHEWYLRLGFHDYGKEFRLDLQS